MATKLNYSLSRKKIKLRDPTCDVSSTKALKKLTYHVYSNRSMFNLIIELYRYRNFIKKIGVNRTKRRFRFGVSGFKPAAHECTCRAYLLFFVDKVSSCAGNIYLSFE